MFKFMYYHLYFRILKQARQFIETDWAALYVLFCVSAVKAELGQVGVDLAVWRIIMVFQEFLGAVDSWNSL